ANCPACSRNGRLSTATKPPRRRPVAAAGLAGAAGLVSWRAARMARLRKSNMAVNPPRPPAAADAQRQAGCCSAVVLPLLLQPLEDGIGAAGLLHDAGGLELGLQVGVAAFVGQLLGSLHAGGGFRLALLDALQ